MESQYLGELHKQSQIAPSTHLFSDLSPGYVPVAVTISTRAESWPLVDIPFYCHSVKELPLQRGTIEKVERAALRRNEAVSAALKLFPNATHILMVDSWYVRQKKDLEKLLLEHSFIAPLYDVILGGYSWVFAPNSIRKRVQFYDIWVTPEAFDAKGPFNNGLILGWQKVNAVGAVYIFPRWCWEDHHYSHDGLESENTYFCRKSGLPCYLSHNVHFQHPHYSVLKRARVSLNLGRFLP